MRIAVISESIHDSNAIINLLNKRKYNAVFNSILKGLLPGSLLDSFNRVSDLLRKELSSDKELNAESYSFILYIRDLDASHRETNKVAQKNKWFEKLNRVNGNNGIFLLNIYELEALILADIDTFNSEYGTDINYAGNPMDCSDPKEFLQDETSRAKKRYEENHCPGLFKKLDIEKLISREGFYFKKFIKELEEKIANN